jgi:hypothetical protein
LLLILMILKALSEWPAGLPDADAIALSASYAGPTPMTSRIRQARHLLIAMQFDGIAAPGKGKHGATSN